MEELQIIQPENTTAKLDRLKYSDKGWNLSRYTWKDPSPEELDYSVGSRVWPAGENERSVFLVKAIKKPGEKYFPDGGVVCSSSGAERAFFLDAVIRHPSEIK